MDQIKTNRGQNKGHVVIKVRRRVCLLAPYSEYNVSININSIRQSHPPGMFSTMAAEGENSQTLKKKIIPILFASVILKPKLCISQSGNVAIECVRAFQQCPALMKREGERQRNNPWQGFILLSVVVCGS